jgi:hypothetical protein
MVQSEGQSAKCQEDPRVRKGDRTGPKWAWAGRPARPVWPIPASVPPPISWAWRWCNPKYVEAPPFAEREPFARETFQKLERVKRREIIRDEDRSNRRKQPQVEVDVETLPRHPRRRRETLSEASPWSMVLRVALDGVIFSLVHGL